MHIPPFHQDYLSLDDFCVLQIWAAICWVCWHEKDLIIRWCLSTKGDEERRGEGCVKLNGTSGLRRTDEIQMWVLTKSPPKSLAGAALKIYPISSGLMTLKYSSSLIPWPKAETSHFRHVSNSTVIMNSALVTYRTRGGNVQGAWHRTRAHMSNHGDVSFISRLLASTSVTHAHLTRHWAAGKHSTGIKLKPEQPLPFSGHLQSSWTLHRRAFSVAVYMSDRSFVHK